MIYTDFRGEKISRLGFGSLRMPMTGRLNKTIDEAASGELIDRLYGAGVNYYDLAYMYLGGKSEGATTRALAKYPRQSYMLADKLPWTHVGSSRAPGIAFRTQLRRCNTDYFDFYLLHDVSGRAMAGYEDEAVGAIPYLLGRRAAGQIRHLGFSTHASPEELDGFLNRHPGIFEFVQIQLNYLDWEFEAKRMYDVVTAHGLPVWVMEPVRGGRLASLTPEADALLTAAAPGRSAASWAFIWLMGLDNVKVILSGMSAVAQAEDNLATFAAVSPLTERESAALAAAVAVLKGRGDIPCTRCRYCCGGCPQKLDIPALIAAYSELCVDGVSVAGRIRKLPEPKQPSACIGCGECAAVCPQGIDIPAVLAEFAAGLAKE